MKRILIGLICIVLCMSAGLELTFAAAEIEKNEFIDISFTMLDAENLFLARYNEMTGSDVTVWFEYGLPYFFGGVNESMLFSVYPQMRKRTNETQTTWYKPDTVYLYGFDCMGYVKWICKKAGRENLDSIQHSIINYTDYKNYYVFSSNSHLNMKMPAWGELYKYLKVGDLFMIKHGGFHAMMYIGTLRDFGFTAEEVPDLAEYLDYPLVIHSGVSPAYAPRYEKVFAADYDYYKNCELMDGGVQVSILGVPIDKVPYHLDFQKQHTDYFMIGENQQIMTVIHTDDVTSYCWYRTKPAGK
ncbi:MAG: hypothetical protein CW338_12355 [Clostridiales bacterium]|nr:hypothetical protein [Clostridiales bacterium]